MPSSRSWTAARASRSRGRRARGRCPPPRVVSVVVRWSGQQLAVDLGTANTVVFRRGHGIVLFEPSVVAIDERSGAVQAVGDQAPPMIGRTPAHITARPPLRPRVVGDLPATQQMPRDFI